MPKDEFSLPDQHVICPKCLQDYFDDDKHQVCPKCQHHFVVGEITIKGEE